MLRSLSVMLIVLALSGCALPQKSACPLPREKPMVMAHLFFGRDIGGRAPLSDAEWSQFETTVIVKDFPDGFTVSDGQGAWRDPQSGETIHEPSKILQIAVPPSADLRARLDDLIQAYRARFHQRSVGIVTQNVCAAF